jgi:Calcineurin-like phosphoesterase
MIRRVYDRKRLEPYAQAVRRQLGSPALEDSVQRALAGAQLPPEAVDQLQAKLHVRSDLASTGARDKSHERAPYLSRDPVQSLLQSELDAKLRERGGVDERPEAAPSRGGWLRWIRDKIRLFLAWVPFGPEDPEWITDVAAAMLERLAMGNHEFNKVHAVHTIGDSARLVIVGDWGSGLPRAKDVATHMADKVRAGLSEGREVHVIHLGDVYYSGTEDEVERNVLAPGMWPVSHDQAAVGVTSWSLNGNHDMYGGGYGYFDTLLRDQRFAAQRSPDGKPTSFFRITSPSWEIVGLDTSWNPHPLDQGHKGVLEDPQAEFVATVASESDKKLMLLSHHQLYSEYDKEDLGTQLGDKLGPLLKAGRVIAWLWGHEHRCMTFEQVDGVAYPRCIGHGGIPVIMSRTFDGHYGEKGIWEERHFYVEDGYHWARFGFAVLDFDGAHVDVTYFNDTGDPVHEEQFA